MKRYIQLLFAALMLALLSSTAFAHSVYIFAWVDGEQVCTESYFTQKNKVRGSEVLMTSTSGDILDKGLTDEDGLFCFSLPEKAQALEFTILAGAGHKGSFTLEEKDVAQAIGLKNSRTAGSASSDAVLTNVTTEKLQQTNASEELIRSIVRDELQKQLSPMRQYLAEKLENTTPGVREIVGGIGWLAGLGALGFWVSQKRKKQ